MKETGYYSRVVNAGLIQAPTGVDITGYLGEVFNSPGGIINASSTGVFLQDGGEVFNEVSGKSIGTIVGGYFSGVFIEGARGYVSNRGVIQSYRRYGATVDLAAGGTVVNHNGGLINGYDAFGHGVLIQGGTGLLTNSGSINAAGYSGIQFNVTGGGITNTSTGRVTGAYDGVLVGRGCLRLQRRSSAAAMTASTLALADRSPTLARASLPAAATAWSCWAAPVPL